MSCPSLPTLHDKASGGAGLCKGNKTIRVFTKTMKEYQNRLIKADIIKKQLRTFVFRKLIEKKPDIVWCRLQWAMLPTIVDTSADYSEQCCRLQSAPKHLNIKQILYGKNKI